MNVVKEIQRINERELNIGAAGSWHDQYKDSAYIFIGGLPYELTEGDVITIFSQYGEVLNVNLPRDKATGKTRGFGFLMYEDQRSTVLAVDNLNGANVLNRTLRVDHVDKYKQTREKDENGEWREPEEEQLNARPELVQGDDISDDSDVSDAPSIDPEDPMRDYLIAKRKEEKAAGKDKKKSKKRKREDETPEERKARKERKREKREKKAKPIGSAGDGRWGADEREGNRRREEYWKDDRGTAPRDDAFERRPPRRPDGDREWDRNGEREKDVGRGRGDEGSWGRGRGREDERDFPREYGRGPERGRPRSPGRGGRDDEYRRPAPRSPIRR